VVTEFLSCRPNLEVHDLAPAAAFLRDLLEFEVEVDEPGMGLMLLRRDAVGLALVRSATPGVNATTTAYIGVTGVDYLHEQCAARGARIVTGLTDHPWGLRDFVVEVPGGHRLALGERIAQPRLSHRRRKPIARRRPYSLQEARGVAADRWRSWGRGVRARRRGVDGAGFYAPPDDVRLAGKGRSGTSRSGTRASRITFAEDGPLLRCEVLPVLLEAGRRLEGRHHSSIAPRRSR
jgi:hypothetical protein